MDSLFFLANYTLHIMKKKIENEGEYFMETNFNAMMTAATDKYTQLIDIAYKLKSGVGGEEDYTKLINIIHSNYMDEADLIFNLCNENHTVEELKPNKEIQIPIFMAKKRGA